MTADERLIKPRMPLVLNVGRPPGGGTSWKMIYPTALDQRAKCLEDAKNPQLYERFDQTSQSDRWLLSDWARHQGRDLMLISWGRHLANWQDPELLAPEKGFQQTSFKDRPGVYVIWNNRRELIYIGQSKRVRERMHGYFHGTDPDRPPTEQVIQDEIRGKPWKAYKYLMADRDRRRLQRRAWIRRAGHMVHVAYTRTEGEAQKLERHLIQLYYPIVNPVLKNSVLYWNWVAFPDPDLN